MNKAILIGNLTRDPELRTTQSGLSVCSFTIAVNRRGTAEAGQQEADFFRITAWRELGENCARFLAKGKKVCVTGPVSYGAYQSQSGETRVQMEVTAQEVEFLSPRSEAALDEREAAYRQQERYGIQGYPKPTLGAGAGTREAEMARAYASEAQGMRSIEEEDLPFD